jgi:hypothetical protein
MSKKFIFVLVSIALIVLGVGVPNFIRARSTRAAWPCINNLRLIESAKHQWMLDRGKTTNDVPTWDDIRSYLPNMWSNGVPVCPGGGIYTLGRVEESPTCSLGDKELGHKLE